MFRTLPHVISAMLLGIVVAATVSGCSAEMASNAPQKRDLGILASGTPRDMVIAELGAPVASMRGDPAPAPRDQVMSVPVPGPASAAMAADASAARPTDAAARYDIFHFVQGRSEEANLWRSALYKAAAGFTFGLSELVAIPLEYAVGDRGEIRLRVAYDQNDRVAAAHVLDGASWLTIPEFQQRVRERRHAAGEEE